jgi:hypothetical protein
LEVWKGGRWDQADLGHRSNTDETQIAIAERVRSEGQRLVGL